MVERPGAAAVVAGVIALQLGSGCAGRTDQRVQAVWSSSNPAENTENSTDPGDSNSEDPRAPNPTPPVGWARLDEILDRALQEAAVGTDPEVFARLADRWCTVPPEPLVRENGSVFVCLPSPPVQIEGRRFSLELGGKGVIGLVAAELSAEASTSLVDEALRRTERWCTSPWTDVSPPSSDSTPSPMTELHTCPVKGSALLVVARFVSTDEASRWQMSVTVIDAS